MRTLRFLAAEGVAKAGMRPKDLGCVAYDLYPVLFKACYLHEQPQLLHHLVRTWPLPQLNLQGLLGRTADSSENLTTRTCRLCLEALLRGLRDHILLGGAPYARTLKVVDLTALRDTQHQGCPCGKTLGRWGRTEMLTRMCGDVLIATQGGGAAATVPLTPPTPAAATHLTLPTATTHATDPPLALPDPVEVWLNAFVTGRSFEVVSRVMLLRQFSPLRPCFAGFRGDSLTLRQLFHLLTLADSRRVEQLEIVHNVHLEPEHLHVLLAQVPLPRLRSLTLPTGAIDVRHLSQQQLPLLSTIGAQLSELTHLTHLSLGFNTLTGHLRRLLSPLRSPLQVLELANCSLNAVDMAYLANSLHSEHLESLDLSGHDLVTLFPRTFPKLLQRSGSRLRCLSLEECMLGEPQTDFLLEVLQPCRGLQELRIMGNPLGVAVLRRLIEMLAAFPALRYVELPVPRECYPPDAIYPLDEAAVSRYDRVGFERARCEFLTLLQCAGRGDVEVCTPLYGAYDPEIHETSNELGVAMLHSFREALGSYMDNVAQKE